MKCPEQIKKLIGRKCATKTYTSNLKYRFEIGIKEISPRFTRRNDSALWCYRRASRDESSPRNLSFRRACSEKSLKLFFLNRCSYAALKF